MLRRVWGFYRPYRRRSRLSCDAEEDDATDGDDLEDIKWVTRTSRAAKRPPKRPFNVGWEFEIPSGMKFQRYWRPSEKTGEVDG